MTTLKQMNKACLFKKNENLVIRQKFKHNNDIDKSKIE